MRRIGHPGNAEIPLTVERASAEAWIRQHVDPRGPIQPTRERPWSVVLRVPLAEGVAWFKACSAVQTFEPRLSFGLAARWPGRVADVLAHDEERAWLLLGDGGAPVGLDASPETWLRALPPYSELQRGETAHALEHLAHGVPDLRCSAIPARYDELLAEELPLEPAEVERLRAFAPRLARLCEELQGHGIAESIQHDDLHGNNVYADALGRLRVLDWGDASISHPFASLLVTFAFLEEHGGLAPDDPWFERLRAAYVEPWGRGLEETLALALRVGAFAHAIAWQRQRDHLPDSERPRFDRAYAGVLRRALAGADD